MHKRFQKYTHISPKTTATWRTLVAYGVVSITDRNLWRQWSHMTSCDPGGMHHANQHGLVCGCLRFTCLYNIRLITYTPVRCAPS